MNWKKRKAESSVHHTPNGQCSHKEKSQEVEWELNLSQSHESDVSVSQTLDDHSWFSKLTDDNRQKPYRD